MKTELILEKLNEKENPTEQIDEQHDPKVLKEKIYKYLKEKISELRKEKQNAIEQVNKKYDPAIQRFRELLNTELERTKKQGSPVKRI